MVKSLPTLDENLSVPDDVPLGAIAIDRRDEPRSRMIARKLSVTARRIVRRFDQTVEEQGVSRARFTIIALVALKPGASQRAIADRLEVTEVSAGRLIERLCLDGFLERRENANDRRTKYIYPTAAARPLL